MSFVLGFAHHTGIRLAEVGFLLLLFAGVWLVAARIRQFQVRGREDGRGGDSARDQRLASHRCYPLGALRLAISANPTAKPTGATRQWPGPVFGGGPRQTDEPSLTVPGRRAAHCAEA